MCGKNIKERAHCVFLHRAFSRIWTRIKHSKPKNVLYHGWNFTIKSIYFVLKSFISNLKVARLNWIEHILSHTPTLAVLLSYCTHFSVSLYFYWYLGAPLHSGLSDKRSNRLPNTPNNVHHLKLWCNRPLIDAWCGDCVCMLLEQLETIMHSPNR